MDRTVPRTGSDEIELYIRTYYSLLRSTGEIQLETLVETHANMNSSLHAKALSLEPDIDAFTYTALRLPECIFQVRLVVLGQSQDVFLWRKYPAVEFWQEAPTVGRRRRMFFDEDETLAVYIASRSDIDDLIPILTAFQIEWNKFHHLLQGSQIRQLLDDYSDRWLDEAELATLSMRIGMSVQDLGRLQQLWGRGLADRMAIMASRPKRFALHLLDSSLAAYRKAIRRWWANIEENVPDIECLDCPVYFISSNTHSITNLLSGFAVEHQEEIEQAVGFPAQDELWTEYQRKKSQPSAINLENYLYYFLREILNNKGAASLRNAKTTLEQSLGIYCIPSSHSFDVEAQIIQINTLVPERFDSRLEMAGLEHLRNSRSLIINIDYPLGMAAYQILTEIARNVHYFRGIYILGKAATLNGRIGDVMIPSVVHDEHSQNTYLFPNSFTAADIAPFLTTRTVMDNQKAITVRGTFLQNPRYMDVFYREGYTDIEMEAGPYLSAITESIRPRRHPYNEIVNLYNATFDIGLIHYASDKPINKGQNLGTANLSFAGLEPTYAASVAILRRIFLKEISEQVDDNK